MVHVSLYTSNVWGSVSWMNQVNYTHLNKLYMLKCMEIAKGMSMWKTNMSHENGAYTSLSSRSDLKIEKHGMIIF